VAQDFVEFVHVGLGLSGVILEALLHRRRVGTGQGALDRILLVQLRRAIQRARSRLSTWPSERLWRGKGVADVTSEVG
jgi:hypothetical protein